MNDRETGNPWLDAWNSASQAWWSALEAQQVTGGDRQNDSSIWEFAHRQVDDWWRTYARFLKEGDNGGGGTTTDMLRRAMDPSQFLTAGSSEINQAIRRLVEAPEFADAGVFERDFLRTGSEWMALQDATNSYRQITTAAWMRVYQTFSNEMMSDSELLQKDARSVLDRWLALANKELIETQRSDEFLEAQRKMLAASVNYRLEQRKHTERWCEAQSIPTRTEVDDMQEIIHTLRSELRETRKRLDRLEAAGTGPAEREDAAKPKTTSRRSKGQSGGQ
ncbi:poly(R)-hydroxyalkanoic acid synthase subunit PhaE [Fulvimarina sp. MAC3]|uniref:poly(R)-hydroxyalkanoic acid synthase subunit PhaE n=1 Tax=Fulvimarina sp. MAC3 TaxID=3148887 RepID=UPI0031FC6386